MDGGESPKTAGACRPLERMAWREDTFVCGGERFVPEETPVAFTYDGASYAVMLATPADLEDFALGFSLTEGIVAAAEEVERVEVQPTPAGIILRIGIASHRVADFWRRRRYLAGPSGCGLCGLESLAQALRPMPKVTSRFTLAPEGIADALARMSRRQVLNHVTHAVHAAGFWHPATDSILVREDVGRHNALDKLAGALACAGVAARDGALLLTSRVSVEMVQKAAAIGAPIVIAVSAPTALAVRLAQDCGITLAAVARADGFEVFAHPDRFAMRLSTASAPHVR